MATTEHCASCGAIIPEGAQICPRCSIWALPESERIMEQSKNYRTITKNGRVYIESRYYREVYNVTSKYFIQMKKQGLPYIQQDRNTWINKQDFFDYHAGLIGEDSWKMKRA